ncbi:RNA-dependent RNA polymerase, eukaryotic-type [Artemisia annua]|uniref:RNA-dependent RNA polymerase n=1 Tax=Artemisia annua TaxID=35608 RepID=A0A2U1MSP3_ARTAN|nr:RNA-dependent RNA polymerase, eukaryotic-type [Artemisia annua]
MLSKNLVVLREFSSIPYSREHKFPNLGGSLLGKGFRFSGVDEVQECHANAGTASAMLSMEQLYKKQTSEANLNPFEQALAKSSTKVSGDKFSDATPENGDAKSASDKSYNSIQVAQLKDLSEKAWIFVQDGRWLMGCLDQLTVLVHGQCFIQVSIPFVENWFAKHGSRFVETKRNLIVTEGYVVIAKNPCLQPGDVQKGDRPHTYEALGSDLDGDLYFVTRDEHPIPPTKQSWPPMEYTAAEAKKLPCDVRHMLGAVWVAYSSILSAMPCYVIGQLVAPADMSVYDRNGKTKIDRKLGMHLEDITMSFPVKFTLMFTNFFTPALPHYEFSH